MKFKKVVIVLAKFKFRMEQMLNIKRQMEESIKNDLANAIRVVELEKEKLNSLTTQKNDSIEQFRELMGKGVSVQKMKEYNAFIDSLENRMTSQKKAIIEAETVADKIRERLVQVVKEKKMLEKLKEKKFEEWKFEQQKKEELALGEIAGYKYIEHKAVDVNGSN
jgi:flagellar FliJ protein